jgi:hypothetical protein
MATRGSIGEGVKPWSTLDNPDLKTMGFGNGQIADVAVGANP